MQHKEAMKKLKLNVDVLTLSATPIPRTLEMSLVGIRDLSLLQTPPADRQPILTFVGEYDERVAVEAIRRELLREGQVFWVHNRVQTIEIAAARLRELVPEARIAVAHGQMDEGTLEQVVVDFWEGRYDVLVCTTIIESGIDMPTVNTLVVERADLLGLGQMHQLRGRVGRSGSRAYAYLFHPRDARADRGGLRAAAHDRRGHRPRQRLQDRDARPRDPRRRQPARRVAERPHRRRRLRPLLPDGHRGGRRDEGRAAKPSRPSSSSTCPTDAYLPTDYVAKEELRLEAYRRLAAVTTRGRGRRHPRRVGGPLRPGARTRRGAAHRRLPPGRVPPAGADATCSIVSNQARLAPLTLKISEEMRLKRLVARRDLQGRPAPARHPDQARRRPGRDVGEVARRAAPRRPNRPSPRSPDRGRGRLASHAVNRRVLVLLGGVVAAATLSSCATFDSNTAATVNDTDISVDELDEIRTGLAEQPASFQLDTGNFDDAGAANGELTRQALSLLIDNEMIRTALDGRCRRSPTRLGGGHPSS